MIKYYVEFVLRPVFAKRLSFGLSNAVVRTLLGYLYTVLVIYLT